MKVRHIFLFLLAIVLGAGATILYLKFQEPTHQEQSGLNQFQPVKWRVRLLLANLNLVVLPPLLQSHHSPSWTSIWKTLATKKTVLPAEMDSNELNKKINEFYQANYSAEERRLLANKHLQPAKLADLQKLADQAGNVSGLETRSIKSRLGLGDNQTSYVVRLVVPMTRQEANSRVKDSDIELMNQALSYVGNRLVLVAYDQAKQAIESAYLTRPALFYYNITTLKKQIKGHLSLRIGGLLLNGKNWLSAESRTVSMPKTTAGTNTGQIVSS